MFFWKILLGQKKQCALAEGPLGSQNRFPGRRFSISARVTICFPCVQILQLWNYCSTLFIFDKWCWLCLQGIKWKPDEHGVIAFDCRNRKWYIQAATSPKDVVILVDVSGSMKGLRLTIARQTVSSILDTLGDDDFFNIIAVSPPRCAQSLWGGVQKLLNLYMF